MQSDNSSGQSVLSLIDLTDDAFAETLTTALESLPGGEAAVLVKTIAEDNAALHMGDNQRAQWLEQVGRFSFFDRGGESGEAAMVSEGRHWQWSIKGCQVLPMSLGSSCLVVALRHGKAVDEVRAEVAAIAAEGAISPDVLFETFTEIAAVGRAIISGPDGTTATYRRVGSEQGAEWREFDDRGPEVLVAEARRWNLCQQGGEAQSWIIAAQLDTPSITARWTRLPYCPELIIGIAATGNVRLSSAIVSISDNVLRRMVGALLATGLKTTMTPFPESSADFEALLIELRKLDENDLLNRLVLGGFADHPVGEGEEQVRCQECIYYLTHRRWCDLPELPIAVEPDWYCRLWRL